jgi:hypothetical protein
LVILGNLCALKRSMVHTQQGALSNGAHLPVPIRYKSSALRARMYKFSEEQPAEWAEQAAKGVAASRREQWYGNKIMIYREILECAHRPVKCVFVYLCCWGYGAEKKTARWSHLFVHAYFLSFSVSVCPRLLASETSSLKMIFVRNKIIIKSDQGKRSLFTPRRWAWAEKMTRTWPVSRRSLISHARSLPD